VSTAEVGMFTVSDLPDAPPARSVSSREAALSEIARIDALREQGLALTPETDAAYDEAVALLKTDTTALVEKVKEAAEAVRYDQELRDAQANVADRVALLESALGALRAIRSDDKAARLNFKRARNAAIREGVPADELPDIAPEVSKMPDVNGWPGCGEGAWTSSWGRG
jgi:hypothetical protein